MTDEAARPAEATLYDDPATADLAAKVSEAWAEFRQALAAALPKLPGGAALEVTLDPTASGIGEAVYALSVSSDGSAELTAYSVSNAMLPPEHRLTRTTVGELVALGWQPPGVVPGSGERFGVRLPVVEADRLAKIVTRTLREVFGTPHPAFLVYAVQPIADPDDTPALGAARALPPDGDPPDLDRVGLDTMPLREKVATVIAAMLKVTPESLPTDSDGDIGIRSGSAMVFVRVRDEPALVDVFSPVLTGVDANQRLYVKLSELTHRMPIGRLYYTAQTVWASVPVFGRDFQASHLMLAVQVMTGLADELDDRLHGEFGGRRFFVESDRPTEDQPDGDSPTGMYL